jgi:hypothetical protein
VIRVATPDEAREAARRILDDDRFRPDAPAKPPQPFRQPLTWLGEQLQKLFEPLGRFLSETVGRGGPIGWLLFALAITAAVVLIARRLGRRVASRRTDSATEVRRSKRIAELERLADGAAEAGRWSEAVRLRFRAGILRLEDAGRVTAVERRPNGEIVAALAARSPATALPPLAEQHDRVAYGEQQAGRADHDAAVAAWDRVRAEAPS